MTDALVRRARSAGPLLLALTGTAAASWVAVTTSTVREVGHDDPRAHLPARRESLDHAPFFEAPFADPRDVTRACLVCHEGAAREVMATAHWTWGGPGRVGKRTAINNFCISIAANWPRCTSCHAGYGWTDDGFLERAGEQDVDCLVCHDRSGRYAKDPQGAGLPTKDSDLLAAARSVGRPTRADCGACHFAGGGGDAVKHGDLDATMVHPAARIDVHMGGAAGLECVDCHRTEGHRIAGRILPPTEDAPTRVACTDCHTARPHGQARLDSHTDAVACQTCHVPRMAVEAATKMSWDWEQAGRDPAQVAAEDPEVARDPHLYTKAKGRFEYAREVPPTIAWYDGTSTRYAPGDRVDLARRVTITRPNGSIADARARLWPFKVHTGRQPADAEHGWLLTPRTFGPGGYWTDFDWPQALRLGAEASGLAYSGRHVFVDTEMWWPINHMVQDAELALQCVDCHGEVGRLDWTALGYPGDPARQGGRRQLGLVREAR